MCVGHLTDRLTDEEAVLVPGSSIWVAWPAVAGAVCYWQWRRRASWPRMLAALALATYGWWVCSVAFFPFPLPSTSAVERAGGLGLHYVNLVPIRELVRHLPRLPWQQVVRQFGGNVLLFVPFTLAGPIFWPRLRSWRWPLVAGLGGSVTIEALQLVLSLVAGYPYRQTDIDDVIVNTCGAFLGYAAFFAVRAAVGRVRRRARYPDGQSETV